MRLYDSDEDVTQRAVEVYLTTTEAADLLSHLMGLINNHRVKTFCLADKQRRHEVRFRLYSEHEQSGFDSRQKQIILEDA